MSQGLCLCTQQMLNMSEEAFVVVPGCYYHYLPHPAGGATVELQVDFIAGCKHSVTENPT